MPEVGRQHVAKSADKRRCDDAPLATFSAHSLHMEKHVPNSGAIVNPTMLTYMLSVSMEVLVMIMSCTQNYPRIRTLLRRSHVNVIALLRPLQTQRSFSPSRQAQIKHLLLLLQLTIRVCLIETEAPRLDEEIIDPMV